MLNEHHTTATLQRKPGMKQCRLAILWRSGNYAEFWELLKIVYPALDSSQKSALNAFLTTLVGLDARLMTDDLSNHRAVWEPSPEEIAEESARIRAEWTPEEREGRWHASPNSLKGNRPFRDVSCERCGRRFRTRGRAKCKPCRKVQSRISAQRRYQERKAVAR